MKKKTMSQLHKQLWRIFSEYIRRKEAFPNGIGCCVSCGAAHHWKEMDAGHFISRTHLYLKYDERNVHPQCKGCNAFKQGNAVGYREELVKRYGGETVAELEASRNFPAGFTRDGLQLRIEEYKEKLKLLTKGIL